MFGRSVYFCRVHGRGHRILPHELNHRANIYALRSPQRPLDHLRDGGRKFAGKIRAARRSAAIAVFDRTSQRACHLFRRGIAAHVFCAASPISPKLRELLAKAARERVPPFDNGGTLREHGWPRVFHCRAESEFNRRNGFDVIGMTNLPEAKLAREAEIALATMAMITDYDCWKEEEEAVSVQTVVGHLLANAETAKKAGTRGPGNSARSKLAGASRSRERNHHRPKVVAGSERDQEARPDH